MGEIIILIISQIVFSFVRNLNVRYTAKDSVSMALFTSAITKVVWIVTLSIGIKAFINEDWLVVLVFVISGVFGDYLSFKVKI